MMKKLYAILVLLVISGFLHAQISYSPLVDSLKNEVTEASVSDLLQKLSGEVPVLIGGTEYTLVTRHSYSTYNPLAAQWIKEQFEAMGLSTEYHTFGSGGENVVATITGTEFPDQQYIVCAHYDDMPSGNLAPGADDNASGVVGVLETARLLKDFDLKYTVKFIAFDQEEQGLIGSNAYASQASSNGDDILGVLNLDMIAWDSDDDFEMSISTIPASQQFTNEYISVLETYNFDLNYNFINTSASDHSPFWNHGYQAILAIEDWYDFNDFYHTINDLFDNCNIPYFKQMVQAAVATMASLSMDMKIDLVHDPLPSGNYTDDRIAKLFVGSSHAVATGQNAPRMYYRVDGGEFFVLPPSDIVSDTFYFTIPGQPYGTTVDYYLAVQTEDGTMSATLPGGGGGMNPPGTIAPEFFYSYMIADITTMTVCSNTVPKTIENLQHLYDTIAFPSDMVLQDLNVQVDISHTYDGDLEIYLIGPDGTQIALCLNRGGSGNNFTGTIFDDEADLPIAEGTPPFTGSYVPEELLEAFIGDYTAGNWILHIFDNDINDQGTLNNWCLQFEMTVGIENHKSNELLVQQNYPNPFKEETHFSFELTEADHISITVLDMMGRNVATVADRNFTAGKHTVTWNAGNMPAGNYFYRLQSEQFVEVKRMMIIK